VATVAKAVVDTGKRRRGHALGERSNIAFLAIQSSLPSCYTVDRRCPACV